MKIIYPVTIFPKLSETFILNQITSLLDLGHEVRIVAFHRSDEAISHPQVTSYELLSRTLFVQGSAEEPGFVMTRELWEVLSESDVVHAHFAATPTDFALSVNRLTGIPFVFTAHAYDLFVHASDERLRAYTEHASRFLTVTDFNRKLIRARVGERLAAKVEVIRCGIAPESFDPGAGARQGSTIVLVGRLIEKKGVRYAIEAFSRLRRDDLQLRILGDGPLRGELEALAAALGVGSRVHFLGSQPQSVVIGELQGADIFLLPSVTGADHDREGLPVVLLEAQAMKLPVVSTLHSGIPEGVIDGETGYLVPERDVAALVEKLERLIDDPPLRLEMGEKGRLHVSRNFHRRDEIARLQQVLQDAAASGSKRSSAELSAIFHREFETARPQSEATGQRRFCGMREGLLKMLGPLTGHRRDRQ